MKKFLRLFRADYKQPKALTEEVLRVESPRGWAAVDHDAKRAENRRASIKVWRAYIATFLAERSWGGRKRIQAPTYDRYDG